MRRRTLGKAAALGVAAAVTTPATAAPAAGPPVVAQVIGTVPYTGYYPHTYVIGTDRHLWVNWQDSAGFHWTMMGNKYNNVFDSGLGVAASPSGDTTYAYVLNNNTGISRSAWAPGSNSLMTQSTIPGNGNGVFTRPALGATGYGTNGSCLFIRSDAGQIYFKARDGDTASPWADHGVLSGDPMGVLLQETGQPTLYMLRDDTQVCFETVTGTTGSWAECFNGIQRGSDGTGGRGACLDMNGDPYVFGLRNGGVDVVHLTSKQWSMEAVGPPASGTNAVRPIGAVLIGYVPHYFVATDDGGVWSLYLSGAKWVWTDHRAPFTAALPGAGLAFLPVAASTWIFIADTNGFLWALWWSHAYGWSWYPAS